MQMRWAGCSHMSFNACHNVGQYPGGQVQRDTFRAGSDYFNRPVSGAGRATLIRAIETRQRQPGWSEQECAAFVDGQREFSMAIYGEGSLGYFWDWRPVVARIQCPTLVILGDRSAPAPCVPWGRF